MQLHQSAVGFLVCLFVGLFVFGFVAPCLEISVCAAKSTFATLEQRKFEFELACLCVASVDGQNYAPLLASQLWSYAWTCSGA